MTIPTLPTRLWTYQSERFPLLKHGVLILVFSGGEAVFGALARGVTPDWKAVAVAAVVCLLLFAQLRIADEHKDNEDDCRWRPERPVPRGLISLSELRFIGILAAAIQIAVTVLLDAHLLPLLLLVWSWMALMSVEFFVPTWLKARPVLYLLSHMAVMPLIALFAVACGARGDVLINPAVGAFLGLAFLNGVVLEIARKSWAPGDEREGVETYSRLWGVRLSATVTAVAGLGSAALALTIQSLLGFDWPFQLIVLCAAGVLATAAFAYGRDATSRRSSWLETASGLFVLLIYLGVAWLPAGWRLWGISA
jgi:4-hydroxybenzoate polyprenyltransferase